MEQATHQENCQGIGAQSLQGLQMELGVEKKAQAIPI